MKELIFFMNNIAQSPVIRSNELFKNFLSLNEINFNSNKKKYEKLKATSDLSKSITLEGLIDLSIDEGKEVIVSNFNKDLSKKIDLFKLLMNNLNFILDDLNNLYKHFIEFSAVFKSLEKLYSLNIKGKELSKIYNNFLNIFQNWGNHFNNQKKFLNDDFKYLFSYMEKELSNLNKCFNNEFTNRRDNYYSTKKLYEKNLNKPNELLKIDEVLSVNKKLYGFMIRKYYEQYYDLNNLQYERLKKYISLFNEKKDLLLGDYKTIVDLLSFKISDN